MRWRCSVEFVPRTCPSCPCACACVYRAATACNRPSLPGTDLGWCCNPGASRQEPGSQNPVPQSTRLIEPDAPNYPALDRTGCSQKRNPQRPTHHILRKEVIQPHLPIRLPCYDFVPLAPHTFGGWLLAVTPPTSGADNSGDVTGGVYKPRERIHRSLADLRLLAIPTSRRRVAACDPN